MEINKKLYVTYGALGIFYVLIKIIFISFGYLHFGAIFHGSIPCILSLAAAIWAFKSDKKVFKIKLMLLLPVLFLIITPVYMYLKQESEWLTNGRLPVLIIYEFMALAQIFIANKLLQSKS